MKRLLILFSIVFSTHVFAGAFVEPWVGYAISGGDDTTDVTGPAVGLRLGYELPLGLQFGLEYFQATQDLEIDGNSTGFDFEQNGFGVMVGLNPPILPLKATLTYFVGSEIDIDPNITIGSTSLDAYTGGVGYKAGVGFTFLPFISLNVEYQNIAYDEAELSGSTVTLSEDAEYESILFTVSLPLP